MRDYIPQLGAPARKRGGWSHSSQDLNAIGIQSASTYMTGVGWSPFPDDPHLIGISDLGKLYQIKQYDDTGGTFIADLGFVPLTHKPFWHKDRMIITQGLSGPAATPKKYISTAGVYSAADLGGTPPQARTGFSWGEWMALANGYVSSVLYNYRIWFSGIALPDSWSPGTSFWDVPGEIVVAVPMRSVILVWGYSNVWMITGDTPPPGGNLATRDLFQGNGCMDARSLALHREYAIWANNSGVWKTDGATLTDLTESGGISQYWRSLVSTFNQETGWSAAGGVIHGYYIITIFDNNGTYVTTLVCDIDQQSWNEFTNFPAAMYAERSSGPGTATADGHEELFFANRSIPRASLASTCWSPSSANASDADGIAVQPEIETAFSKLETTGLKRVRRVYVTHDVRSAGASPSLAVSVITSPESSSYTSIGSFPTTTKQERKAVDVRRQTLGVGFKIAQVGASADTRLSEVELEGWPLEESR